MAQPDYNVGFQVHLDACAEGLGAVLQQKHMIDGRLRDVVICYISRQTNPAESRYGATQLECLALVWALQKLHHYLDGYEFEVHTDCTAVTSLLKLTTPTHHMM